VAFLSITCVPVLLGPEVESILCIAKDITLIKQYDAYIKEKAGQLNSIMENIPESFYALDSNGCYNYLNAFYTAYLGKSKEDSPKRLPLGQIKQVAVGPDLLYC
jgi:PAS domain-containing protein